jgi:putative component of toxin-antitoxin plasmid stabilization module
MNQLKKHLAMMLILLAFAPLLTEAKIIETKCTQTTASQKVTNRLNEIHAMDKSHLTTSEKKELRKEVLAIRKNAGPGGGVYLSVGAIIIIVLILIVLF